MLECLTTFVATLGVHNVFLFHLYTPIEFAFVVFIFVYFFKGKLTSLGYFGIILFFLFCIVNVIFFESLNDFNSIPRGFEGLIVICLSIYFFFRLFIADEFIHLMKYPYFWLFSGWLLYFSGTFFLFIYSSKNAMGINFTYLIIHSVLNIFLNIVYAYSLWLGNKKTFAVTPEKLMEKVNGLK